MDKCAFEAPNHRMESSFWIAGPKGALLSRTPARPDAARETSKQQGEGVGLFCLRLPAYGGSTTERRGADPPRRGTGTGQLRFAKAEALYCIVGFCIMM